MESKMNFMALLVAGLIPMIMGFIYYHPSVLGNTWMKANGFTKENMGSGPKPTLYILSTILSFMLAFFMWGWTTGAGGVDVFQVTDAKDGHSHVTFQHGLFHGLAFTILVLTPIFSTNAIFEKKSFTWAWVNILYWGLSISLMCGILSVWR